MLNFSIKIRSKEDTLKIKNLNFNYKNMKSHNINGMGPLPKYTHYPTSSTPSLKPYPSSRTSKPTAAPSSDILSEESSTNLTMQSYKTILKKPMSNNENISNMKENINDVIRMEVSR